jgi:hypothetical protein
MQILTSKGVGVCFFDAPRYFQREEEVGELSKFVVDD